MKEREQHHVWLKCQYLLTHRCQDSQVAFRRFHFSNTLPSWFQRAVGKRKADQTKATPVRSRATKISAESYINYKEFKDAPLKAKPYTLCSLVCDKNRCSHHIELHFTRKCTNVMTAVRSSLVKYDTDSCKSEIEFVSSSYSRLWPARLV